ncbi:hypothetical protein AB6A40_011551 [Gnathostoma spinigerum]|uniref:Nematode cuticle collagen N-terminal domain-containing protein n=1 Tax=Gnathostoma spinigerum TaxID=75299 RepID=A0ABD6F463_9BILA
MDLDSRIKAYKFVAYSAVTFSVVAVLSVCVTLPMVYNYVHHVRQQMRNEVSFCKVCTFFTKYIPIHSAPYRHVIPHFVNKLSDLSFLVSSYIMQCNL